MIVGTRGSELALTQTNYIRKRLFDLTNNEVETKIIKTTGDKITTSQLYNMDSKGLFTKELDRAVLEEEVDLPIECIKKDDIGEDLEVSVESIILISKILED